MQDKQVKKIRRKAFQRLYGVKKKVFYDMVKVVKEYVLINKKSGRKNKLSIEEQVLLTLSYLREYRTYFHLGIEFGLNESNVYRTIIKIESILIKSELFKLPGQKTLTDKATELSSMEVIVDVTETEIERPQKKQKKYYSGKKKKHTLKSEIFADKNTKQIICTGYGIGAEHDFKIFKKRKIKIRENILILGDKGYLGIDKIHANSKIPHKKKKGEKLTKEQKKENKELNKERVIIEHINRKLKKFRILSSRYRNRRKRFGLRLNLIAGIYNYSLISPVLLIENS